MGLRMRQRQIMRAVLLGLLFCSVPAGVMAGEIDLAWDPVPGAMGYRVFYGSTPNSYGTFVEVLNGQTSTTLSGLTDGIGVDAFSSL